MSAIPCSECQRLIDATNSFCNFCGCPNTPPEATTTERRRCAYCGDLFAAHERLCTGCGAPANGSRIVNAQPAAVPQPRPTVRLVRQPARNDAFGTALTAIPLLAVILTFLIGILRPTEVPGLLIILIDMGLLASTSMLAYSEVSAVKRAKGDSSNGVGIGWCLGMLVLWALFYPAYMSARTGLGLRNRFFSSTLISAAYCLALWTAGHLAPAM